MRNGIFSKRDAKRRLGWITFCGMTWLLILTFGSVSALADPVTPLPFSASVEAGGAVLEAPPATLPLNLSETEETDGGYQTDAATVLGGLDPSITISASGWGGNITSGADLDYSFVIEGPTTLDQIPVLFGGSLSSTQDLSDGDLSMQNSASVYVLDSNGNMVDDEDGGEFDADLSLTPGSVYYVYMSADIRITDLDTDDEPYASIAYVDPTFTIGSQYANDYTISYSPGLVPNTPPSATPEPSSIALFGTAFLLIVVYRKRQDFKRSLSIQR